MPRETTLLSVLIHPVKTLNHELTFMAAPLPESDVESVADEIPGTKADEAEAEDEKTNDDNEEEEEEEDDEAETSVTIAVTQNTKLTGATATLWKGS